MKVLCHVTDAVQEVEDQGDRGYVCEGCGAQVIDYDLNVVTSSHDPLDDGWPGWAT